MGTAVNVNLRRIAKLCAVLNSRSRTTVLTAENIEMVPCGYKTSNTPPTDGWKPLECLVNGHEHFWLRTSFVAPEAKPGKRYLLSVETTVKGWDATNPQGLIYLNGKMASGLDTNHTTVLIEAGKAYDLHVYFYTGDITRPILPNISVIEEDVEIRNLYYDFKVPYHVLEVLNENTQEFHQNLSMLEQAANLLDLRTDGPDFHASVANCRAFLDREYYNGVCTPEGKPVVHAIGHTHIDVEWRWHRAQTREKTQRSMSTAVALMNEYPEYKFTLTQPELYRYLKEEAPEKYEEVKAKIEEGQWEPEGAMWVECDCNLTSGESLVRQILQGKRYFKEEFGVDCKILFLPDVFGYSAALPQILKKSGIDYFITSKISWSDTNQMPVDSFVWEGIDGTTIYSTFITTQNSRPNHGTHNFTTYVGHMTPTEILGTWDRYQQKAFIEHVLTTYGFGDGGGGPTREMIEYQRRLAYGIPGMPVTKPDFLLPTLQAAEKSFYENCQKLHRTPKWTGELYLEIHRGTYTSIAKVKKGNRKSEQMLQKAEAFSYLDLLHGGNYDAAGLYAAWRKVLHNQFHDILPGSSIGDVYDGTDIDYAKLSAYGYPLIDGKIKALADRVNTDGGLLVANSLGFARGGKVTVDGQTVEVTDSVPSFGWKVVNPVIENRVSVDGLKLENDSYVLKMDESGAISSLFDKQAKRPVNKAGEKLNQFQAFDDHPYAYDAWELSPYYKAQQYSLDDAAEITAVTDGSRRGFKVVKKYMNSTITQHVWLYSHSRRIDFDTEIDWHEKHQVLKVAFPFDIHTNNALYDVQFGHLARPTHESTPWDAAKFEVCGQKWADLSEKGYGVSLLNDCKYGHNTEGGTLKLTCLKCATEPYPDADQGLHTFSYALLPHTGDLFDAGVIEEAYAFNQPLDAVAVGKQSGDLSDTYSLVSCDAPNVIVETVKKAEDSDDMIVRMYEAWDSKATATLTVPDGFRGAKLVNLMEEDIQDLPLVDNKVTLHLHNFEIVTVKFIR